MSESDKIERIKNWPACPKCGRKNTSQVGQDGSLAILECGDCNKIFEVMNK